MAFTFGSPFYSDESLQESIGVSSVEHISQLNHPLKVDVQQREVPVEVVVHVAILILNRLVLVVVDVGGVELFELSVNVKLFLIHHISIHNKSSSESVK